MTTNELLMLLCEVWMLQDYSEHNVKPRKHSMIKVEILMLKQVVCVCVCVCVCVVTSVIYRDVYTQEKDRKNLQCFEQCS